MDNLLSLKSKAAGHVRENPIKTGKRHLRNRSTRETDVCGGGILLLLNLRDMMMKAKIGQKSMTQLKPTSAAAGSLSVNSQATAGAESIKWRNQNGTATGRR